LQVLHAMCASGKALPELAATLKMYPQVLVNVPIRRGQDVRGTAQVQSAVDAAEARLQGHGRVLLRPSGTEPVLRVMVEGESEELVRELAASIAASIPRA
jgi:phosphoglucosamine mutase